MTGVCDLLPSAHPYKNNSSVWSSRNVVLLKNCVVLAHSVLAMAQSEFVLRAELHGHGEDVSAPVDGKRYVNIYC